MLTAYNLCGKLLRIPRNRLLAHRLGAAGLHIGRHPRIAGLAHIHVGSNVSAGDAFWLEAVTSFAGFTFAPAIRIGHRCSFSDRVHIAAVTSVTIGNDVLCGSNVLIIDHAHGSYSGPDEHTSPDVPPNTRPLSTSRTVEIGDRVWLGDNVSVLPGARIGAGSVIAAHSVVTGDIPANVIALGSPARPIRRWEESTRQWLPLSGTQK